MNNRLNFLVGCLVGSIILAPVIALAVTTKTFQDPIPTANGGIAQNSSSWTGLIGVNSGTWYQISTSSASAASSVVFRDANQNAFAQNFVSAGTSFPTNGGTVTLTNASPRNWIFTGTNTQTMKLPSGTTLTVGTTFTANNNSTLNVTVVDNGSNTLATILPGGKTEFVISDISSSNGLWDAHALLGHYNVSGTFTLGVGSSTPWGALAASSTSAYPTLSVEQKSTGPAAVFTGGNVGIASTSPNYSLSVGSGLNHFRVSSSNGEAVGCDATNSWCGRISPTGFPTLQTGTTTTWTATTSAAYVPFVPAPYSGTAHSVSCIATSTGAFLGINLFINNTPMTPSYFVASNTPGIITLTGNNIFVRGDRVGFNAGTTTTDANAQSVSCYLSATETP